MDQARSFPSQRGLWQRRLRSLLAQARRNPSFPAVARTLSDLSGRTLGTSVFPTSSRPSPRLNVGPGLQVGLFAGSPALPRPIPGTAFPFPIGSVFANIFGPGGDLQMLVIVERSFDEATGFFQLRTRNSVTGEFQQHSVRGDPDPVAPPMGPAGALFTPGPGVPGDPGFPISQDPAPIGPAL